MTQQTIFSVLLVSLSWVFSGLITYGYMKAKIGEFDRRLVVLEHSSERYISRIEYDARHGDMIRQLDRIEKKLDERWQKNN